MAKTKIDPNELFQTLAKKAVTFGKFIQNVKNTRYRDSTYELVRLTPTGYLKLQKMLDDFITKEESAYYVGNRANIVRGLFKEVVSLMSFLRTSKVRVDDKYCKSEKNNFFDFSDLKYGKDFILTNAQTAIEAAR